MCDLLATARAPARAPSPRGASRPAAAALIEGIPPRAVAVAWRRFRSRRCGGAEASVKAAAEKKDRCGSSSSGAKPIASYSASAGALSCVARPRGQRLRLGWLTPQSQRRLGGVSEESRKCLGGVSEESRKCLGGVSAAPPPRAARAPRRRGRAPAPPRGASARARCRAAAPAHELPRSSRSTKRSSPGAGPRSRESGQPHPRRPDWLPRRRPLPSWRPWTPQIRAAAGSGCTGPGGGRRRCARGGRRCRPTPPAGRGERRWRMAHA